MSPLIVFIGPNVVSAPSPLTLLIIPPALTLIPTLVSTVLLALSSPLNRDRLFPNVLLALNIVLSSIAGGLCIAASLNHAPPFHWSLLVLWSLHECLLSVSSLYVLFMTSTPASLVRRTFRFVLFLLMAFLTCETIAGSISSTPALLAPILSLIARGLLLLLAIGVFCDMHSTTSEFTVVTSPIVPSAQHPANEGRPPSTISPRRDSSPAPDTWPFPASLAHTPPTCNNTIPRISSGYLRLLFMLLVAQTAAVVCAAFTIALAIILENAPPSIALQARSWSRMSLYFARRSRSFETTDIEGLIIAHSVFSLIWGMTVVTTLYLLPSIQQTWPPSLWITAGSSSPNPSEKQSEFTVVRTPKPSHSRFMPSDSASDFLSMRDPFASPHPRPALPTAGLGLDADHTSMRPYGIAPQYRFPAPKAKKRKGTRKTRTGMRMKPLEHQASTKPLLPHRPPTAQTGDGECSLKDEVLLAQLLLQSLTSGTEAGVGLGSSSSTNVVTTNFSLPIPQSTAQVQPRLGSRWSATTAPSMTASTPRCEKKSLTSSECARKSQEKNSEARKSTETGVSMSSLPLA